MDRRKQLDEIFRDVDEDKKRLVDRLLDEVVYLEEQMEELKKLPFLAVHPENSSRQKVTPAAKLYKECSQSYMNAIRILAGVLNKVETSAQDDLMSMLEQFR